MCNKVVIPTRVDAELINNHPHTMWDKITQMIKKSAIKNKDKRKVIRGIRDWDAFLEGKDVRHEYIFASREDLLWAVNTLEC